MLPQIINSFSESLVQYADVWRTFQFDYIYFDLLFLALWCLILLKLREYQALIFGAVIAPLIFGIDAGIWWHTHAADPTIGNYIREYWISGKYVSHTGVELRKFAADFMMTVSYSLYAFPWLWIGFRSITKCEFRRILTLTGIWALFWTVIPFLSQGFSLDDTPVRTVRHMQGIHAWWILATLTGYTVAAFVYRHKRRVAVILLLQGAVGALIMEIPLHLSGIRSLNAGFLLFEAAFLLNQAVPFLFILYDKLLLRNQQWPKEGDPNANHRGQGVAST